MHPLGICGKLPLVNLGFAVIDGSKFLFVTDGGNPCVHRRLVCFLKRVELRGIGSHGCTVPLERQLVCEHQANCGAWRRHRDQP